MPAVGSCLRSNYDCVPISNSYNINNPSESSNTNMEQQQSELNSIIITSAQLNNREQFAFMQRTLLVQIFKEVSKHNGTTANGGAEQDLNCPTCVAFSDRCCQSEPSTGQELFREFVKINLDCYWDASLAEALNTLR